MKRRLNKFVVVQGESLNFRVFPRVLQQLVDVQMTTIVVQANVYHILYFVVHPFFMCEHAMTTLLILINWNLLLLDKIN